MIPHTRPNGIWLSCLLLFAFNLIATNAIGESEPAYKKVAEVEGISEYQLPNGLRVLLFPDPGKQQITVNITYLVGSRHEGYGETGMAHLLEHMLFQGSTKHPNISQELTEQGASPNGTTANDRTNYFETFAADQEKLEWALDLEADRMVNSFIRAEDLESEMTVVRNEMERGENSSSGILYQHVIATAFLWHNYGNSVIGARSDVENVPIERLRDFYRKYYQPDNAVLIVTGRFDTDYALGLITEKFGSIPRPDRSGNNTLFKTYTAEPAQEGERSVTLRRVGEVQHIQMSYHIPSVQHADAVPLDVLSFVLSDRPSGRLYKALVETEIAAGSNASSDSFHEPGMFSIFATARKEGSLVAAEKAVDGVIEEMIANGPTEEEIERTRLAYFNSFENIMNNPQAIAGQLSEWSGRGDWRLFFLFRDALQDLTADQVHQVAKKYIQRSNRTIGYFYPVDETPARVHVPPASEITSLVNDYKGRESVEQGEAFDATNANIDARTQTMSLSNGIEVAMLPKKNRGATVVARVRLNHGNVDALMHRTLAGDMAGGMLMLGTTKRTRQEIIDEFIRLKIAANVDGGATNARSGFRTVRENLPAALELVAEILTSPAFLESEFSTLKNGWLAGIEAAQSEPNELANNMLSRHVNDYPLGHPNYVPTFAERKAQVEALELADLKAFHRDFYGGSDGSIVVVGDFDPKEIAPKLELLFGSLSSDQDYVRIPNVIADVDPLVTDILTPDKANAVLNGELQFAMSDDHPDYPAMMIASEIVGGGFLSSRLATRIRQKEGLSYGVGAYIAARSLDEVSAFSGYAIFAPENADKVLNAFKEELQLALDKGFKQEELDVAVKGFLDSARNGRASDSAIANSLANNIYTDRTMVWDENLEQKVRELQLEDVNEAFRRYMDVDRMSFVRAGDFAKHQQAGASE